MKPACSVVLLMACAPRRQLLRERGIRDQAAGARPWRSAGLLEIGRPRATHTRRQPAALLPHEAGRPVDAAVAGELGHGRARLLRLAAMHAGMEGSAQGTRRAKVANKSQPNLAFCHSGLPLACPTRQQACPFGGRVAWASRCFAASTRYCDTLGD